jgi:hypothetical protein
VGFVVLNAGRSPCDGVVGGVDSVFEGCFAEDSGAVHPTSKATEAAAATARLQANPYIVSSLHIGRPALGNTNNNHKM